MRTVSAERSAVILAGGEGSRLHPVSRYIAGDDRPKQFCRLINDQTMLGGTRRRAQLIIPRERLFTVVTQAHEQFYAPLLTDVPPETVVVQPANRGTAPALLYALLRLISVAPSRSTVLLPADHYVSDDHAIMDRIEGAIQAVHARPDLIVLLGVRSEGVDITYSWIEPGQFVLGPWTWPLYRIRRFWVAPTSALAEMLHARECLWDTHIIIADPRRLLSLISEFLPALAAAFATLRPRIGTAHEYGAAQTVYKSLDHTEFSGELLSHCVDRLTVLPVTGITWGALSDPTHLLNARQRRASTRQRVQGVG